MRNALTFLILLVVAFKINAENNFLRQHRQGWHWYQGGAKKEVIQEAKNPELIDPVQQMKILQAALEKALDQAILQPTPTHITAYIQLQNQVNQRANQFSKIWQQVIWQHPDLNYALQQPTNQVAREIYLDTQSEKLEKAVKALAKTHGLFFFFKGSCPYCHRFAPVVKDFVEHFGISLLPISLDGGILPQFPHARLDNGISNKFRVTHVPALFAVAPQQNSIIPLCFGIISRAELLQRILALTERNLGDM